MTPVLDNRAPCVVHTVKDKTPTPWSKAEINEGKTKKRRLEKKWKRSKQQGDFEAFKEQRNKYNTILNNFRENHLSKLISNNKGNSCGMFKALNYALHRKVAPPLPPHDDDPELANRFMTFLMKKKISKIRAELDISSSMHSEETYTFNGSKFCKFREMTQKEEQIILNNMSKSCNLDPLPIWLAKECIDEFLKIVKNIINLSLSQGTETCSYKASSEKDGS